MNPWCQAGGELALFTVALKEAVLSRTLSCLLASWLAEWTEPSQPLQRKASSEAQYQRARLLKQLSQALAVLAPTALAALVSVIMKDEESKEGLGFEFVWRERETEI